MTRATANIAIAGSGRMARGIALSFAYAGYSVELIDSEERPNDDFAELVASIHAELASELEFLRSLEAISPDQADAIRRRVDVSAKNVGAQKLPDADFVFEAVTELMEIKQSTFDWVDQHVSERAVISSTTSTMSPDALADCLTDGTRFCNAHWLNPAHLMPLVEVCPAAQTTDGAVAELKNLLSGIGKVPVVCKSSPGFILSRIQALVLNEAARLVEEGVASAEDVDKAIRTGLGIRYTNLGALEFIDWGGGDILYHASRYLASSLDEHRFASPDIVNENMQSGRNGLRDGQGFYDYHEVDIDAYRSARLTGFVRLLRHLDLMPRVAP